MKQQKEIETIRERKIMVKLSDVDYDRLERKCEKYGLTIGELENMRAGWKPGKKPNMDEELETIKKYIDLIKNKEVM